MTNLHPLPSPFRRKAFFAAVQCALLGLGAGGAAYAQQSGAVTETHGVDPRGY